MFASFDIIDTKLSVRSLLQPLIHSFRVELVFAGLQTSVPNLISRPLLDLITNYGTQPLTHICLTASIVEVMNPEKSANLIKYREVYKPSKSLCRFGQCGDQRCDRWHRSAEHSPKGSVCGRCLRSKSFVYL